jgi:hypothetical protein
MGVIASVLYAAIFRRAFYGATYCARAPLFWSADPAPSRPAGLAHATRQPLEH